MVVPTVESESEESADSALAGYVDPLAEVADVLCGTVFVDVVLAAAVSNFAVGVTLATLPAFGDLLGGPAVYALLLGALDVGRLRESAALPT